MRRARVAWNFICMAGFPPSGNSAVPQDPGLGKAVLGWIEVIFEVLSNPNHSEAL